MNRKYIPFVIIGSSVLISAFIMMGAASARTSVNSLDAGINYPIAELGNCKDKESCKTYCNDPAHIEACVTFAEKNNLMSKNEIDAAKKFLGAGAKGPGGCTNQDSCENYCNDISHINECVSYAEKTGILPPDQLAEAKRVQTAIASGVQPPPCKNKKECDAYCDNPSHMKTCVAFGEAAGFLKGQELQDAKKIISAMDRGVTPPPCSGKDACDVYCSAPEHVEACVTFAQAAGLISPQEAQNSDKVIQAIKKGVKPPACRGKDECDKYCGQSEHFDECTNFAVAAGFMSAKDAEIAKKTGGKGPGECRGKEECNTFCNNPDNQQTCVNFAKDNGLIPPEELQRMQDGQKQFQASFQNMPPEVFNCLKNSIGLGTLEKFKSGQAVPSRDIGEKIGQCFSKMGGPPGQGDQGRGGPGAGGPMPPGQLGPQGNFFGGPGGCKTPDECKKFCEDNPETCKNFQPPMRPGIPPNGNSQEGNGSLGHFTVPGGCKTPEECNVFCRSNPEVCKNFQPPATQHGIKPQEHPVEIQQNMPSQGQGEQGQNHGEIMPLNQGMPLRGGQQFNGTMPPGENMPPGNMPPQYIQSGNVQPMQPPFGGGLYPPQNNMPQPGNVPPPSGTQSPTGGGVPTGGLQPPPGIQPNSPPPPQSYNPSALGQFLLSMIVGVFSR